LRLDESDVSGPAGPHGISRWDDPKLCEALGLEYLGPIGD
jgi:hypothetical protein